MADVGQGPSPTTISPKSHLITLRIWREEGGGSHGQWRGKLHHVATDEVAYFRDWVSLLPLVLAMLRRAGVTLTVAEHWDEPRDAPGAEREPST